MENLEVELRRVSEAWRLAVDRHVLGLQALANAAAALIASVCAIIAMLLLQRNGLASVFGLLVGAAGFGAAGLVLASGVAAVHRQVYFGAASAYGPWRQAWRFLQHNCSAIAGGYGVCYGVFLLLVCVLLILTSVARLGEPAQLLFAVLLIPLVAIAAAAVMAMVYGVFVATAEAALNERSLVRLLSAMLEHSPCRCCSLLRSMTGAFAAAALAALPPVALLLLSIVLILVLAGVVVGIVFTGGAILVMCIFAFVLLAVALAPATALFAVLIGAAWRDLCEPDEPGEAASPEA